MAQLVFLKDDRGLIRFPLRHEEVSIGRGPACEITLEGVEVSRTHAVIRYWEGFYEIEDRSKNGTRVNGEPIQKARLKNEDTIGIGDWRLQFLDDAAQENPETVTVASGAVVVPQPKGKGQEFAGMIGTSPRMKEIFRLVEKVAKSPATTLILGETGTGKELVANALHQTSGRALLPFVVVNCAAISENLVESELFGHERGAFTGAIQTYRGAFERAETGTLFLDEIGELSFDLQSKFLRTLEVQKIRRVGGSAEIPVKCRVVAATHRNLSKEVKEGRFREDLYYRLFVMPIEIPPLRQRREDIPPIARYFLAQMRPENPPSILKEAMQKLEEHLWPGNIRELKNVILRAALLTDGDVIEPHHIVFLPQSVSEDQKEPQTIIEMEKEMILQKLKETNGNKTAAARELGIATSTIFKKIKDYGL